MSSYCYICVLILQAATAPEQQVLQSKAVHAQAVNSGDRAVQHGLQTARASYLEDRAREESRRCVRACVRACVRVCVGKGTGIFIF